MKELKKQNNIIPTFRLKRKKNNKNYYTFYTREATDSILNHLILRKSQLKGTDPLFKMNISHLNESFKEINETLSLKKVAGYNRLRAHMLRRYHASRLATRNRDDEV